MEILTWKKLVCDCNLPFSEEQKQEQEASTYSHRTNIPNKSSNTLTQHRNKQIFSFKYSQFRRYQQSQKFRSAKHTQRKFDLRLGSPQPISPNLYNRQIIISNLSVKNKIHSPQLIGSNTFNKAFQEQYSLKQNRNHQFFASKMLKQINSECTNKTEKKCEKKVRIQVNNSPYCQKKFKQSEVTSNNYTITHKKKQESCISNNVIIQETQSSKTLSSPEYNSPSRTVLENLCQPFEQNQMQLMNARTIQSIMSPNHTKSHSPSGVSTNQQLTIKAFKESPPAIELQSRIVKQNAHNSYISPISVIHNKNASQCLNCSNQMFEEKSQQFLKQQKLKSGCFYTQKVNNLGIKSQKVSVLDLHEQSSRIDNDEEEELRDVIDSHVPSISAKTNRPSITIFYPKKHVTENDKFENAGSPFSQFSPQHSRQVSIEELAMLTKHIANLRRTNTVESMHSEQSVISSVDVKFMQQLKAIPGQQVIKLV